MLWEVGRVSAKILESASKAAFLDHVVQVRHLTAELGVLHRKGSKLVLQRAVLALESAEFALQLFNVIFLPFLREALGEEEPRTK